MKAKGSQKRRDSNSLRVESLESRLLLAGDIDIRISEILATNASSFETRTRLEADDRYRGTSFSPDWIEIQNLTDQPLNVGGRHLTDNPTVPKMWAFPDGTTIPASGYLIVYASGLDIRNTALDETERLHTNFNLTANDGGYLAITTADGIVSHSLDASLPKQFADVSYGVTVEDSTGYFVMPTPGGANSATYDGVVSDTTFSVDRGFYEQPFQVELHTNTVGAEIRYTTDGSPPTADHGEVYSSPIEISTTTNLRAAAFREGYIPTNVDTHTYVFLNDVLQQPAEIDGFPFGGRVWAGSNTYVPQDTEMDPEIVSDPAYADAIIAGLRAIPTLSIASDPSKIFSNDGWYDGENVEEAVGVEVIYPDDPARNHQANAGIESHSHDRLKRSLRLNFRGIYGDSEFQTDLFQTAPLNGDTAVGQVKRIVLRGGNNRSWARIWNPDKTAYTIDEFYRSTQLAMSGYGMRGNYVHLYINGVYWGLYNPVERADEFYTADYFGGDSRDWFVVNHGGDVSGNDDRYDNLWRTLARADLTDDAIYEDFKNHLDVEAFSDYLIASWWMAVSDWPQNNWYGGNRNETSELGASEFRFFAWDGEWSFGQGGQSSRDGKAHVHSAFRNRSRGSDPASRIWHGARQNLDFMTTFADRVYANLFNEGALTEENAKARWETLTNYVRDAVVAESARWGDSMESAGEPTRTRDVDWQREVDRINGLITGNTEVFIAALRDQGYYPEVDPPVLSQHGGRVSQGFQLGFENPNDAGAIYVTQDGSDPRLPGGDVSPTATVFAAGETLQLDRDVLIKARVLDGTVWSALGEASFVVNPETSLRITEIMYNPAAPTDVEVAAGFFDNNDFEFIEIQNVGELPVQLQDYEFNQGFQFQFPEHQLSSGEYLVVAKNVNAFRLRYGETPVVVGQFQRGSLSNGGEQIVLQDPLGHAVLDIQYDDADLWPERADGVGASLQLVDSLATPFDQLGKYYSWQASREFGGSPGDSGLEQVGVVVNEVLSNSEEIGANDSIELLNTSSNAIDLGGWYLSDSSENLFKFQIPDGTILGPNEFVVFDETHFNLADHPTGFALSGTEGDDVWLIAPNADGFEFVDDVHFSAARAGESFGRAADWNYRLVPMTTTTLGSENADPRVGPIVISEVHYRPGDPSPDALNIYAELTSSDLEFVEVYNSTPNDVTMTDWRIRGGIDFEFPESLVLPAGQAVVVVPFDPESPENATRTQAFRTHFATSPDTLLIGGFQGRLGDDGDTIRLLRPEAPPADRPDFTPRTPEDTAIYDSVSPWPSVEEITSQSLHRSSLVSFGVLADSWLNEIATPGSVGFADGLPGDFDGNGAIDAADIDILCNSSRSGQHEPLHDLVPDGKIDQSDLDRLIRDIIGTVPGDANLDGVFNSRDLVQIFSAAEFEDGVVGNSGWATGDWNCDGEFTTNDLVAAFQEGAYSEATVPIDFSLIAAATQGVQKRK